MLTPKLELVPQPRAKLPIQTLYYFHSKVVKKTRSSTPINAVQNTSPHLRRNEYGADVVEVIDLRNGKLHAVIRRSMEGATRTLYEAPYDPKTEEGPRYGKQRRKRADNG